jgi:hypothetical protein
MFLLEPLLLGNDNLRGRKKKYENSLKRKLFLFVSPKGIFVT